MAMSPDATMLAEQGARVLAAQVLQDDPRRGWRVVRALCARAADLTAQAARGHCDEPGGKS